MKNMLYLNKITFAVASLLVIASCESPIDSVGPSICPSESFNFTNDDLKVDVIEGVSVKTLSDAGDTIDFSKGGLHIHAKFDEVVSWEMKITNETEERSYSGLSDSINVFWYGQGNKYDGSNLQFIAGEASIDLEVVCMELVSKVFTVSGEQNFKGISSNYGVLLRDWDQNGAFPISENSYSSADGWAGSGSGANPFEFEYYNTNPSPAGGFYCQFHAETTAPSWYLGATSFDVLGLEDMLASTNTDELYLNFFAKANDDLPNSASQVGFKVAGVNYGISESITWSGWRLISHKLSDYKSPSGAPLTTSAIETVVLQIGSQPEAVANLEVMYDFMLITVGEPLFKE
jgi:hypothetical protein